MEKQHIVGEFGYFQKGKGHLTPITNSSLLQLSGAHELVTARSNARKADLEAGPLDSHDETNHRRGSKTVPKP